MLNIRSLILSVVLVVLLMLAVPLVTASTEAVSNPAGELVSLPDNLEASADQRKAPIASYRSQFGECFDVPIRELAACLRASQASVQEDQSHVDKCSDISNISELAGCRNSGQKSTP